MSTINDRNGMDLTEAEDIKKRWHDDERRVDSPALSARGSRPSPRTSDEAVS